MYSFANLSSCLVQHSPDRDQQMTCLLDRKEAALTIKTNHQDGSKTTDNTHGSSTNPNCQHNIEQDHYKSQKQYTFISIINPSNVCRLDIAFQTIIHPMSINSINNSHTLHRFDAAPLSPQQSFIWLSNNPHSIHRTRFEPFALLFNTQPNSIISSDPLESSIFSSILSGSPSNWQQRVTKSTSNLLLQLANL